MNKAGFMRIGAMLAVLAVLAGVFAGMPYWTARAANKTIWGLVNECSVPGPSYLQNVIVTLTDAHTGTTLTNSTWRDGSFIFNNPPPGSYLLRFQIADHYTVDYPPTGAFRYDGSIDVNRNVCLERMPTRNSSLAVLVVDQTSSAHMKEDLTSRFPRTFRNENIASGVNTATGMANVSGHPVVRPSYTLTWSAPGSSFVLQETPLGSDYTWVDLFAGTVRILNSTIISSLQGGAGGKYLNVSYQFSGTTARLSYFPVLPGSTTVWKNDLVWPASSDWTLNNDTGWLTINGNFVFGTDKIAVDYSSTGVVSQATVNLFNTTKKQSVASGLTDSSGFVTLSIWKSSSDLELQVKATDTTTYQPFAALINTNAVNSTRVTLVNGIPVFGHAFRAGGGPTISTNVVGFLYNINIATPAFKKVIAAKVSGSLYVFYAEPGQDYRMVVDADGYQAADLPVSTRFVSQVEQNVVLSPSLKEQYLTYVTYNTSNWSMAVINRTLVLRPDTTVPGLELPGIRSLGLQVDYTLGNKDGISWNGGEAAAFGTWLHDRLADYITTDGFLTTNGQAFNSSVAPPYTVNTPEISPSVLTPKGIFVNTTVTYTLRAPPVVANGKATYLVNVTTPNDSNTTQYKNQVVVVKLPNGYEMTQKRITGSITTTGWTTITVDPGLAAGTSRIDMTIQKSANGTARVMAKEPAGKFFVLDDALTNYTAVVAANKNITFSAEQSTDPVGNIRDANFTWRFTNNTNPNLNKGYNITATFNYTNAVMASRRDFIVNLTVIEAGGNHTYRDIKVYVDDTPPIAVIMSNRTGTNRNANGTTLKINEDIPTKFDASGSNDTVYAGAPAWLTAKDKIPDAEGNRGYRWDYEGDHIVDSNLVRPVKAFDKPGRYNMTLQVMDWVGHTSTLNATLTVYANDTTKPTPNIVILDPSKDWAVTTSLIEGKEYAFNASTSSDNYEENKNLSYSWYFPGPVKNASGSLDGGHWFNGTGPGRLSWNITVSWTQFNLSYNVTINVTDRGFRAPGDPQKPNTGNRTVNTQVSVDVSKHPDLKYVASSLKIEPAQPEEGQMINISFMIENDKNRANATDVRVKLTAKDSNGAVVLENSNPQWLDANWTTLTDHRVDAGKRVRLIFLVSFPAQGNKSIEIRFNDTAEPYLWVDAQNRVTGSVFVKLAGWVLPAAIIGIIALIIGAAVGLRTYSRYKSGELVFRKKEKPKKEKKKLEEPEEEAEEAGEPIEDAKGKKRL